MGYALLMALPNEYNLNALRKDFWDKENGREGARGAIVFGALFIYLVVFPKQLLSVVPGVNAFAHSVGF